MSLESIGSFCISSFICWRALLKYSEEWTTDTVSLRWFDVRFKSGCLGSFHFNLKGGLCYVYLRFVGHLHPGTPLLSWTAHPFRLYQMHWLVNSGYKDGYALHLGLSSHPPVGPTTSVVLLDFLYVLCDWDRCLLILSSVLFMKIFDSIFQMTSSKVIGLRLFTGPCVFFGFGRGSRISVPSLILVSFLSWIPFSILAIS